jgi:hypothetical protein
MPVDHLFRALDSELADTLVTLKLKLSKFLVMITYTFECYWQMDE